MAMEFHCTKCGTLIYEGDVFCVSCGNRIDWNVYHDLAAEDTKAEEEAARQAAEEETKRKAEEEAARKAAAEEAKRKAEEEAARKAAEEEAKRKAEEEAARQREEEEAARREIAAAAQRIAEQEAIKKAEEAKQVEEVASETRDDSSEEETYCVKCGYTLPKGAMFCMHCGQRVESDEFIDENAPEPTVVLRDPAQIRNDKPEKKEEKAVVKPKVEQESGSKPASSNGPIKKVSESVNLNAAAQNNVSAGNRYNNPRVAMANQMNQVQPQVVRPVPMNQPVQRPQMQAQPQGSKVGKIVGTIIVMIALMVIACAATFFVLKYMDSKSTPAVSGNAVNTEAPVVNDTVSYLDDGDFTVRI